MLTEYFCRMIGIKEPNNIDIKVLLQPQNVTFRSVEHLRGKSSHEETRYSCISRYPP